MPPSMMMGALPCIASAMRGSTVIAAGVPSSARPP
jgi:hypothetical protein